MLYAHKRRSRKITSVERAEDSLVLRSEYGIMKISPKNEHIVRVSFICNGCTGENGIAAGELTSDTGIGISYDGCYADWSYSETDSSIILKTSALAVEIAKESASLRYFDNNGGLKFSI